MDAVKKLTAKLPKITDPMPINIIIHVLILFTILSCFFFLYVTTVETDAFNSQIRVVGYTLAAHLKTLPESAKGVIRQLPLADAQLIYSVPDEATVADNAWLQQVPFLVLPTIVAILIVAYLACNHCFDLVGMLVRNLIIFVFIAGVEIGFFYFIASKYVPVPPSTLMNTAYARIQSNAAGT